MASEAQRRAVKNCDARNYFKLVVRFPKEQEQQIREAAEKSNQSMNSYIVDATFEKMNGGI